jgi:hypothetical protein
MIISYLDCKDFLMNFLRNIILSFIAGLLLLSHNNFPIAIIADCDVLLIIEDAKKRLWEIGPSNFIGWYNPITIKEDYFSALNTILPHTAGGTLIIRDGYVLPQAKSDWLSNTKPAHEIKSLVLTGLKDLTKKQGKNTKISQAIANYVFSPDRYACTMVLQKKGKSILKKCAAYKDRTGKKANKVFLYTNWNQESFVELLKNEEIKKAFSYFDDKLISGEAHKVKPDPEFFILALKKFNIQPGEKIIYIDCEITNIKAVQSLNIQNLYCIHFKGDFKQLEKELIRLGAYIK